MRWIKDNPLEAKAALEFAECFKACPDPILFHTEKLSSVEEKIAWTLLGTVIFQDLSYTSLNLLLARLVKAFPGDALWRIPVPKARELESLVTEILGGINWQLKPHFSGIFWSVGLFIRKHFPLSNWVSSRSEKELWRDLGEIYFMGKQAMRPKVCGAIYRLVSKPPYGLGLSCKETSSSLPLPLSLGARRYLAFMGPAREENFSEMSPEQKQKLADVFFTNLSPESPIAVAHGLQFFWENGKEGFICREFTRDCLDCPLREFCKEAN